jgi:hypothetical protein
VCTGSGFDARLAWPSARPSELAVEAGFGDPAEWMAYDEELAERVRQALPGGVNVAEKKMFGGLAFMLDGHMSCGIVGGDLMLRLGPDRSELALAEPHVRPMDFTGRALKGFVYVAPEGLATDVELRGWIEQAVAFASSLPPK